jgi:hypothetical protein
MLCPYYYLQANFAAGKTGKYLEPPESSGFGKPVSLA